MKTLLLATTAILATLNIHAQSTFSGSVNFSTAGVTDPQKQIWVNDTGILGEGTRAAGNTYNVALYWAPAGTTDDRAMTQIGVAGPLSSAQPGTFNLFGRTITYPSTVADVNGAVLAFQVRGWSTAGGSSYDAVLATGDPQYGVGKNPIFELKTKDEGNVLELRPAIWETVSGTPNPNYRGFALSTVPEPSVIVLGLLGAGALLILRRRK